MINMLKINPQIRLQMIIQMHLMMKIEINSKNNQPKFHLLTLLPFLQLGFSLV